MKTPLLALAALLAAAPASADTLISNVNGIQVGADGQIQRFRALTVTDDGKVGQVIENPELVRLANITRTVDGGGRTLLPGLIDAHGHIMGLGFAALQLDLTGTRSLTELQQRLKAYAEANPDSAWIVGRGWNQESWSAKSFPTAADLDAVVTDRPVWLTRVDGHAAIANSAAMRAAGVSSTTQAPTGGRIDNGLFVDNAMSLVADKIPEPNDADRDRALAEAQRLMLANGLTAAADMGTSVDDWDAMRRLGEAGRLDVRIIGYSAGLEPIKAISGNAPSAWLYGDRLRMAGVKLYADGALGSRGAWLKRPYADKPDTRGLRFLSDPELMLQAGQAASGGAQVAIHAIGDAANDQVIGTFERLRASHPGDRRWRVEHVQVIDPGDISRLAKAGIIASMQPTHQTSDRLMAENRLDPARLEGAYAWRTIQRAGALLAFGSDFPVESPNPFPGIAAAVSRQDPSGAPPGGWRPEERVSFEAALVGFTRNAAYAGFAEERIGSLEPGKWADFIFIDRDPTGVDPQSLAATQVLETWVAGKRVWARAAPSAGAERGK